MLILEMVKLQAREKKLDVIRKTEAYKQKTKRPSKVMKGVGSAFGALGDFADAHQGTGKKGKKRSSKPAYGNPFGGGDMFGGDVFSAPKRKSAPKKKKKKKSGSKKVTISFG